MCGCPLVIKWLILYKSKYAAKKDIILPPIIYMNIYKHCTLMMSTSFCSQNPASLFDIPNE